MIQKIKERGEYIVPIEEYIATSTTDIDNLPKNSSIPIGSSCFCIENNSLYMYDGSSWTKLEMGT